jgi:hypothetical protein
MVRDLCWLKRFHFMSELNGVTRASWRVQCSFRVSPSVREQQTGFNISGDLISVISKRLFELAVCNTRLYIRVRLFDESA